MCGTNLQEKADDTGFADQLTRSLAGIIDFSNCVTLHVLHSQLGKGEKGEGEEEEGEEVTGTVMTMMSPIPVKTPRGAPMMRKMYVVNYGRCRSLAWPYHYHRHL